MKLEFLPNINEYNDHVVRLYDFNSDQAKLFQKIIDELIADSTKQTDLSALSFIEAINCKLILRVADNDEGITFNQNKTFFCDMTITGYSKMSKIVEPFCQKETKGIQWLYDLDNPIDFLFSAGKTPQ